MYNRARPRRRRRGLARSLSAPPQAGIRHLAFVIRHWPCEHALPFGSRLKAHERLSSTPIPHPPFPIPCSFVRTLTKSPPSPDFVRTLTTFRSLRRRARRLRFGFGDLRQFCPLKNPSKTEQNGTKPEQNGHTNRKNRSKTSAFCLTYLNIRPPNRPSRPRINDRSQKKRAFGGFGEGKIDVSIMQVAACVGPADRLAAPITPASRTPPAPAA